MSRKILKGVGRVGRLLVAYSAQFTARRVGCVHVRIVQPYLVQNTSDVTTATLSGRPKSLKGLIHEMNIWGLKAVSLWRDERVHCATIHSTKPERCNYSYFFR